MALLRTFLVYSLEQDTLARSVRTALVVGTLLGIINHYPALLALSVPPTEALQIVVTYLVPFSVATYAQVQAKRQRDRERQVRSSPGEGTG